MDVEFRRIEREEKIPKRQGACFHLKLLLEGVMHLVRNPYSVDITLCKVSFEA